MLSLLLIPGCTAPVASVPPAPRDPLVDPTASVGALYDVLLARDPWDNGPFYLHWPQQAVQVWRPSAVVPDRFGYDEEERLEALALVHVHFEPAPGGWVTTAHATLHAENPTCELFDDQELIDLCRSSTEAPAKVPVALGEDCSTYSIRPVDAMPEVARAVGPWRAFRIEAHPAMTVWDFVAVHRALAVPPGRVMSALELPPAHIWPCEGAVRSSDDLWRALARAVGAGTTTPPPFVYGPSGLAFRAFGSYEHDLDLQCPDGVAEAPPLWEDPEAAILAMRLDDALVGSEATYQRVKADIDALRAAGHVVDVTSGVTHQGITLGAPPDLLYDVWRGDLGPLDCALASYAPATVSGGQVSLHVRFPYLLDTVRLASELEALELPRVGYVSAGGVGYTDTRRYSTCVSAGAGDEVHYGLWSPEAVVHAVSPAAGQAVEVERWDRMAAPPEWLDAYAVCDDVPGHFLDGYP